VVAPPAVLGTLALSFHKVLNDVKEDAMIRLEMSAKEGQITVRFDVPDKPNEKLRLDELATFALHLDVIKHRITDLTNRTIGTGEGYDLRVKE
jgi:hypothetical protein